MATGAAFAIATATAARRFEAGLIDAAELSAFRQHTEGNPP